MSARRRLLRWGSWFAVANAAVLGVVGVRYLWYYSALGLSPAWVYAILAYVGQMSALAYLPFLLLLVPAIVLLPRQRCRPYAAVAWILGPARHRGGSRRTTPAGRWL